MRSLDVQHPSDWCPVAPNAVHSLVLASSVAQAADWPGSSAAATQGSTGRYLEINANTQGFICYGSTGAAVPSSSLTSGTSAACEMFQPGTEFRRKIPGGTTGYSVITPAAGIATVSFWN